MSAVNISVSANRRPTGTFAPHADGLRINPPSIPIERRDWLELAPLGSSRHFGFAASNSRIRGDIQLPIWRSAGISRITPCKRQLIRNF